MPLMACISICGNRNFMRRSRNYNHRYIMFYNMLTAEVDGILDKVHGKEIREKLQPGRVINADTIVVPTQVDKNARWNS